MESDEGGLRGKPKETAKRNKRKREHLKKNRVSTQLNEPYY